LLLPLPFTNDNTETINAAYIKKVLARSLVIFKPKGPGSFQDWFLSLDNSQSSHRHFYTGVLVAKGNKKISYLPCVPDIVPADFFLFPRVKLELVGFSLSQDSFRRKWVGVMKTIAEDEIATALWQWHKCSTKCVGISSNYIL
jgi:hypothetical protein